MNDSSQIRSDDELNDARTSRSEGGKHYDRSRPTSLADEAALDAFRSEEAVALVQFYTNGCGLCQQQEPVLGLLGQELDIAVGLINPRDDPPLVERFDVQSVPLLVLFVDGEPVARRAEGFVPGDELAAWLRDESGREL